MIPQSIISPDFVISDDIETDRTYKIKDNSIQGFTDGLEALEQAVYKLLHTEKFKYPIYRFSYGIELDSLIGKDPMYVRIELMRRLRESLLRDDRIQKVDNFTFTVTGDELLCTFDISSIYGAMTVTKEVTV